MVSVWKTPLRVLVYAQAGSLQTHESIPWNAHQDQADEELHKALDEENDEDKAGDKDQCADHCLAVSNPISNPTIDHETKNLADQCTIGKTRLPCSRQIVSTIRQEVTKPLLESGHGEQVHDEDNIEALHCNRMLASTVPIQPSMKKNVLIMAVDKRMDHPAAAR